MESWSFMAEIFCRNKTKKQLQAALWKAFELPFMEKRSSRKTDSFIVNGYRCCYAKLRAFLVATLIDNTSQAGSKGASLNETPILFSFPDGAVTTSLKLLLDAHLVKVG